MVEFKDNDGIAAFIDSHNKKMCYFPFILIEQVTKRHSKKCCECGEKPVRIRTKVVGRKLQHKRWPTIEVFCARCSISYIRKERDRLERYLGIENQLLDYVDYQEDAEVVDGEFIFLQLNKETT